MGMPIHTINYKLSKLFNLPKGTEQFTLKVVTGKLPEIICSYYPKVNENLLSTKKFKVKSIEIIGE